MKLIRGDKRRWLAERCLAHYDEWRATLDGRALLMEIEEPRMRAFVARELPPHDNQEPSIPEEDSETAYEECITKLTERESREESRRLGAALPKSGYGELTEDWKELLRQKERLRDGGSRPTDDSPVGPGRSSGEGSGVVGATSDTEGEWRG